MVEAAPNVRAALQARYAGNAKIAVLTPEQAAALPAGSFDLIVMHSVAQYLSAAELDRLLACSARCSSLTDWLSSATSCRRSWRAPAAALALLRFGAANGFFWAAVFGLMRIFVSDYLRLKKTVGLSHYAEATMLEKLKRAGYAAERAARNIGHNQQRMTFLARRA